MTETAPRVDKNEALRERSQKTEGQIHSLVTDLRTNFYLLARFKQVLKNEVDDIDQIMK
ncbi:hypothetical protein ES705_17566 [subsurface metagenome]